MVDVDVDVEEGSCRVEDILVVAAAIVVAVVVVVMIATIWLCKDRIE